MDELALYAFGAEGLEELKTRIDPSDTEQVFIGFLRVDTDELPLNYASSPTRSGEEGWEDREEGSRSAEDDEAKYLLVSYVPKGVLGVRRGSVLSFRFISIIDWVGCIARAQVHTRRLGMVFKVSNRYSLLFTPFDRTGPPTSLITTHIISVLIH